MARCEVCFRRCELKEGQLGFCGARVCRQGQVRADNYGRITSSWLDPIEKKPLNRFHPGSMIMSFGSYGCNLRCPFCQNYEISWSEQAMAYRDHAEVITPEQAAFLAENYRDQGNIGAAFTYNEPLVGYEFVRDTARLVHEAGMVNVMVTNGTAQLWVLRELIPYIDAMNIDLKGFTQEYYRWIGGDLEMVKAFIALAVQHCHVELTTLIIPGENDSEQEMRSLTEWVAGLRDADGKPIGEDIPLHISRFFPRFKLTDRSSTQVRSIHRLVKVAGERLRYVYRGNC